MKCELTGTPERKLEPEESTSTMDLTSTDNPTASEIADMVLSGELDMSRWRYVNDIRRIDAFLDLIGIYASFKFRKELTTLENRSELLSEMINSIRNNIEFWAEQEVEGREAGFKTLL